MRKAAVASGASIISLLSLCGGVGGCHEYNEPPFNPREMTSGARLAARERVMREKDPIPTTMQSRPSSRPSVRADADAATQPVEFVGYEPIVRLSLQEIIQRTVAHNSDVAVAGYEPAIDETRVVEAEARFDPALFASVSFTDEEVLSPSSSFVNVNPFRPSGFQSFAVQTGIRQNFFGGGQGELSYRSQRIFRDEGDLVDPTLINPYYLNEVVLRITQPLLRDFGVEINQARITIARNNQKISVLEFRRTLEEQIAATEEAYWQLVQAVEEVEIQEELLAETIRTADILNLRAEAGADVTKVQTAQAEAAVASRQAELVRARSRVRDVSDELKRRMGDPAYPTASAVVILPAVDPLLDPIEFDPAEQFDTALRNRLELGQQQHRIDSAAIALNVAKNNILPQLNLVGQVAFQGAGEDLGEAFDENWEGREPSYQVSLEFEIPFGNRLARSVLRRAQLQRRQAVEEYMRQIKLIELDVSTALREVDTSYEEITKRREAVIRSLESLRAIQARREAEEALTPTFVQLELDSQQTYANARAQEQQAIRAYNVGISRLERAKGTLLRYNNIVMQERQLETE